MAFHSNDRLLVPGNPFINIKNFTEGRFAFGTHGKLLPSPRVVSLGNWKGSDMKKAVLALATAATIGVAALATSSPALAWRGGWGWGPGLAGGLIAGAVIGGIASNAYAYGPGYGYYGGPRYYYGGYAPAYYRGYAPAYYNYGYAPAYGGGYYGPPVGPAYGYGYPGW